MTANNECTGDKCGYRRLYEGSQVSLADMAARQGAALGRVGRLRGAIATVLRRNFPDLSGRAEQQLGARLSDVDDEILIAYLEAFVSNSLSSAERPPVQALRAALLSRGIAVSGDDLSVWITQLGGPHASQERTVTVTGATPEGAPGSGGAVRGGGDRPALLSAGSKVKENEQPTTQARNHGEQAAGKPGAADDDQTRRPNSLASIFADAGGVELWGGTLGNPGGTGNNWSPSPVAPSVKAPAHAGPAAGGAKMPSQSGSAADHAADRTETARGGKKLKEGTSDKTKAADTATEGITHEVKPDTSSEDAPPTTSRTAGPEGTGDVPSDEEAGKRPDATADETLNHLALNKSADSARTVEQLTGAGAPPRERQARQTQALKPELIEQPKGGKRKRQPKQLRLQAEPPQDTPIPAASPVQPAALDPGTKEALTAAASIPRPVFFRDLVGITGDAGLVEAWERECRADPANHPVRFISPKVRHRNRGSLVFGESSKAASASPDTWWGKAISTYRGARLYELAVLLHRVGDQLVSHKFDPGSALLRLSTDKGLNGVLITFDTQFGQGEATREALEAGLAELLEERLVLITVLTTSAEPGSLDSLVKAVEDIAQESRYKPVAPVVAARSWEYADDRGTTSLLVLGG